MWNGGALAFPLFELAEKFTYVFFTHHLFVLGKLFEIFLKLCRKALILCGQA